MRWPQAKGNRNSRGTLTVEQYGSVLFDRLADKPCREAAAISYGGVNEGMSRLSPD